MGFMQGSTFLDYDIVLRAETLGFDLLLEVFEGCCGTVSLFFSGLPVVSVLDGRS